jgi:charged multivesicular body protein 2B
MFKKKVDTKEVARNAKKVVRSGERDLDKELRNLDRTEKQIIVDIKKLAKKGGSDGAVKTLARQLVTLRQQRDKLYAMRGHVTAVGHRTTAVASQAKMATIMSDVTGVMKSANDQMSAQDVAKIMASFARENEVMGMQEDLMDDALIDAFDGEGVEEESDAIVDSVLAEIGLETLGKMASAPTTATASATGESDELADLEADELLRKLQAL